MSRLLMALFLIAPRMLASGIEPQPLDLCAVASDWQQFSGKTIRLKARFQEGAEQSVLSDPGWRNGEPLVFVSVISQVQGRKSRLRRILRKNREAEVVLEGVFRGPEPAAIDPKLPEWMKERLKGPKLRYGHLGTLAMMIEVAKIVEAERVSTKG